VAEPLAEQVRVWDRLHLYGPGPRILLYPADTLDEQIIGDVMVDKRHNRVAVQWRDPRAERR
jgi:protein-L-isoaspartate(D-aspartate) O-methyltransferase